MLTRRSFLNATGVAYWQRVSPGVLTDLLERAT